MALVAPFSVNQAPPNARQWRCFHLLQTEQSSSLLTLDGRHLNSHPLRVGRFCQANRDLAVIRQLWRDAEQERVVF